MKIDEIDTKLCLNSPAMVPFDGSRPSGRQLHTVKSQNNFKLTNFMKISRIEGYNGKYGSNPQGIKEILDDLFEFDQIE